MASAHPARSAHSGSLREFDRPSASSAIPAGTDRGERKSACQPWCRLDLPHPLLEQGLGQSWVQYDRILTGFPPDVSRFVGLSGLAPSVCQQLDPSRPGRARGCPAADAGSARNPASPSISWATWEIPRRSPGQPMEPSHFTAGGSRGRLLLHASVAALRRESRAAMLPAIRTKRRIHEHRTTSAGCPPRPPFSPSSDPV